MPCFADEILDEVDSVLRYPRIRKKTHYTDEEINDYVSLLGTVGQMTSHLPRLRVVVRDPNDDTIIACALKAVIQPFVKDSDCGAPENVLRELSNALTG